MAVERAARQTLRGSRPCAPLNPRVVALGGRPWTLLASLTALRRVTGQHGRRHRRRRRRVERPAAARARRAAPGDLRMALAALCGDDEWGRTWSEVVQHRFRSEGALHQHAVGNLLSSRSGSCSRTGRRARLGGPPARGAGPGAADVRRTARHRPSWRRRTSSMVRVRGQVDVATTAGRVRSVSLLPAGAAACPEAVGCGLSADWVVLGPGSWFTSVLPHLLVPELADALRHHRAAAARRSTSTRSRGDRGLLAARATWRCFADTRRSWPSTSCSPTRPPCPSVGPSLAKAASTAGCRAGARRLAPRPTGRGTTGTAGRRVSDRFFERGRIGPWR